MSEMFKIICQKNLPCSYFFIQKWVKTKLFYLHLHTNRPVFTGIIPFSEFKKRLKNQNVPFFYIFKGGKKFERKEKISLVGIKTLKFD